jgi:hypothetical protein
LTRRISIGVVAACLLLTGPVLAAPAGEVTVPISGLAGPGIQMASAQRTSDGGAILASWIPSRAGSARGRTLTARVLADGALDLAYGGHGIATVPVDPRQRLTALAIDPATGAAWIGMRLGARGPGEIVALNGAGGVRTSFGRRGVLALPAADAGGPVALAWQRGALLIAAGAAPCRGCSVSIRDPRSGEVIALGRLSPSEIAPAGCAGAAISSAVFVGAQVELTTTTSASPACRALIVALNRSLRPAGSAGPPAPAPPDAQATSIVIVTSGVGACIASTDATRIAISPWGSGLASARSAGAPLGRLVALVPLGAGACSALIAGPRGRATVAQMSAGDGRAVTTGLPRAVAPLTMFRCHRHLLVVGATGRRRRAAVIVAVPIRRGSFAGGALAGGVRGARAAAASTGCR